MVQLLFNAPRLDVRPFGSIGYARASVNLYHPIGLVDPTMNNATSNVHGGNVYGAVNLDVDADPAPSILGLYIYIFVLKILTGKNRISPLQGDPPSLTSCSVFPEVTPLDPCRLTRQSGVAD